jgi:3-deoxy-7-phosphoheptulonate synthase
VLVELKNHLTEGCPTVEDFFKSEGLAYHFAPFETHPVYVVVSYITDTQIAYLQSLNTVAKITQIATSYQLASRKWKTKPTVIKTGNLEIGGQYPNLIAGPCAVESEQQLYEIAHFLSKKGVKFLRGGAYKPRTSPYSFQGLKKNGLELLRKVANEFDMQVVTEVLDYSLLDEVMQYADILQVGTRNMHNYQFLKGLGKIDKPVLLKRGLSATIEEWLLAAEHILLGGNEKVILCERGIRTFETATRNTLDLSAVALVKDLSHLPVIVDPSQGTGLAKLIAPMSVAAIAAGADGLMIETHNDPDNALSDGHQSLNFMQFEELLISLRKISQIDNRPFDFDLQAVNLRPN